MSHVSDPADLAATEFPSLADVVGNTPLVRLTRITAGRNNVLLAKLEGHNPAGSVKDRPALSMFNEAEARGEIQPGDTLVEATSGNTGIALAMVAAIKGYRMVLVMPSTASSERKQAMGAYGATLIEADNMEHARDIADGMIARGEGKALDQFANQDNPLAHYRTTGPELWQQTQGRITHFVSSMGTTGTIMGTSRYLKEQNPAIEIVGLQPADGASIAGIRRWPEAYLPRIFDASRIDRTLDIAQRDAEVCMRRLAREEGILAGVSSGGALAGALTVAEQVENAVIVFIVCDRGDRYLSTGLYTHGDDL
ncbi:cysteine synthase CysM [Cobetia marina]|jgi:cysteine synthase B|uniref:cysteine synthase CysM n=1 Tax=Cobetia TaxID=204286 RepID=UPI000865E54C|nr:MULTISPECIES: cysteine synthase CysM [Cobetia]AOM01955.1 cysteine synthase B [Cobetia marina]MDA5562053.1 cysteine synthase CysM [Cobetia sp. MMG027]MDH2372394.1 cysteine synthase CysM [Cobetia sp. 3AK]MDI6001995.1 cysteine synthase CysM [Cobetia pacifica]MDN2655110.1 cysteine synthase CysM [Cobetia sp. 14N.309.X.WAT.E.A4]